MPRYIVRYNRGWLLLCDVMVSIGDFGSSRRGPNPLTTTNKSDILRLSKPNQTRLKDWIRNELWSRLTLIKIDLGLSSPVIA